MGKKVSIQDLSAVIAGRTGSTKKISEDFLRAFQSTIEEGLEKDGLVKIKGLGTFKLVWNEPRRSVNIQTGEEYIIAGHYKVSFIPESLLKEIIDSGEKTAKMEIDPLKKLNEQAEEIKDILADLQSIAPDKPKKTAKKEIVKQPEELKEIVPEEEVVVVNVVEEKKPEPKIINATEEKTLAEEVEYWKENAAERTIPVRRRRGGFHNMREKRWIRPFLISLFVVLLLCAGNFAIWRLGLVPIVKEKTLTLFHQEAEPADIPITEIRMSDTVYIHPVEKKKEVVQEKPVVVSEAKKEPKIASTSIFDQPRVYKSFIGTDEVSAGKTLTKIALEHYGHKNFWVYIYEANKDRIKNPNALPRGFLVKLPKLPEALVDENNPEAVKYAGDLEKKYTAKQ